MQFIAIVKQICLFRLPYYLSKQLCTGVSFVITTSCCMQAGLIITARIFRRRRENGFVSWRGSWHPFPPYAAGNCDNLAIVSHNGRPCESYARAGVGLAGTEWAG